MPYTVTINTSPNPHTEHVSRRFIRRLPPVLQLITPIDPAIEHQLDALIRAAWRADKDVKTICRALEAVMQRLGYRVRIGMKEIHVDQVPSFPGETVASALILMNAEHRQGL
ncbi:MAG: hypothetical protein COV99_09860 [Bacteroidetes bacterium CG12_big_fil_rev_8_21_14_0_65_60_17]|nr:MAG: hypothetical protein COV99_09860 [Bacteroidetes bacterium CG12_big_fil_rev_8_21_14_0_65_60_17]